MTHRLVSRVSLMAMVAALAACTHTSVTSMEVHGQGAYIIGYTENIELRQTFEDRLVDDLTARNMRALPSYPDFPSIEDAKAEDVVQTAAGENLAAIVIVNPVRSDKAGPVKDPRRATPEQSQVRDFFAASKAALEEKPDPNQEMFAEVNAYLIEGNKTRLIWSGVTWNFHADGAGSAISDVSTLVADNLAKARDQLLGR